MNGINKINTIEIFEGLKKHFPDPRLDLHYNNNFELLIVLMLSAQTTDKMVNKISPILFGKYPNPKALADANSTDLANILNPLGFSQQRAEKVKKCSEMICREFSGDVPATMEELLRLPGVGKKTASSILVNGFNKPALVVDTHVMRIATERLKLSKSMKAETVEQDLAHTFPIEDWQFISNAMVLFGRYVCIAKNPKCKKCHLLNICPYENKNIAE